MTTTTIEETSHLSTLARWKALTSATNRATTALSDTLARGSRDGRVGHVRCVMLSGNGAKMYTAPRKATHFIDTTHLSLNEALMSKSQSSMEGGDSTRSAWTDLQSVKWWARVLCAVVLKGFWVQCFGVELQVTVSHGVWAGEQVFLHEPHDSNAYSKQHITALKQETIPHPGQTVTPSSKVMSQKRESIINLACLLQTAAIQKNANINKGKPQRCFERKNVAEDGHEPLGRKGRQGHLEEDFNNGNI
jgi:hypothetical protein